MRVCPKCGYTDPPYWRNKKHNMYTDYCRIDELEMWDPEFAEIIKAKKNIKVNGYIYHLTRTGQYIYRIHERDSFNGKSWREPEQEKHLAKRIIPLNQRRLLECEQR